MSAAVRPSCVARIAAVYPPFPPPTTTRSNSSTTCLALVANGDTRPFNCRNKHRLSTLSVCFEKAVNAPDYGLSDTCIKKSASTIYNWLEYAFPSQAARRSSSTRRLRVLAWRTRNRPRLGAHADAARLYARAELRAKAWGEGLAWDQLAAGVWRARAPDPRAVCRREGDGPPRRKR